MKKSFLAMVLILTFALVGCNTENNGNEQLTNPDNSEFVIGLIPSQSEGEMESAIEKLTVELSEKLDRPVKINHYPAYNAVVEALIYQHIDMAYFGPLTYVIAHERSGAKAIITQLVDGEPYYYSYIITKADAPWNSIDDLLADKANVNFAFGSMSSTSGSLIPSVELKERGVFRDETDHDFSSVRYTGSHDVTAHSVLNNEVDAGAIDSAIFEAHIRAGRLQEEDFKIIWTSEKLFQYPWAVHSDMDEATVKQLQDAFLEITDEDILNAFGATGFTTATNEDYASLREAAIKDGRMDDDL